MGSIALQKAIETGVFNLIEIGIERGYWEYEKLKITKPCDADECIIYGADNEIYIDQSGATANIDLEQLGSGNIVGGLNSVAGTLTALDLDGLNLTLILIK